MQIQINTDHSINGSTTLIKHFSGIIEQTLSRYSRHLTRVEAHLSDENSNKKNDDKEKRCLIEARIKGSQPIAVKHKASSMDQAVAGAADKLVRLIENKQGKQRDQ